MGTIAFNDLLVGIGFLLVIEGILFAAVPAFMRSALASVQVTPDHVLRAVGLVSAVIGLIVIWLIRQ
jgi:uncharacterized protein YjeT (DUF2065 family)